MATWLDDSRSERLYVPKFDLHMIRHILLESMRHRPDTLVRVSLVFDPGWKESTSLKGHTGIRGSECGLGLIGAVHASSAGPRERVSPRATTLANTLSQYVSHDFPLLMEVRDFELPSFFVTLSNFCTWRHVMNAPLDASNVQ